MLGVTQARVTQWITAGLIDGAAIVGEGGTAMIDLDIGRAQLKERRALAPPTMMTAFPEPPVVEGVEFV